MKRVLRSVGLALAGLAGLVILATAAGALLPAETQVPETVATLRASPAELFPLFNSRAGQRRIWTGSGMSLAWRSHMVNATTPLVSQMVSSSQEFVEAGH